MIIDKIIVERETYLKGVRVKCTTEEWLRCMFDKELEKQIIERSAEVQ